MECLRCGKPIPDDRIRRHALYCSNLCAHKAEKERYREANPFTLLLPTATIGAISEYRVVIDCLSKGYEVFRACSPSCSCDLAIIFDTKLKRIEVRTGRRTATGKINIGNKQNIRADILAIVMPDKIIYRPELPKKE